MTLTFAFSGQVALVTGAGSGIERATAKAFAESGAAVILADVDEKSLTGFAEELTATGAKATGFACDVADEAQVAALVDHIVATYGHLDMAFNNAGVQAPASDPAELPAEEFGRVMDINLRGVWACMKHELKQMRQQRSGAIVNCSSAGASSRR